MDSATRPSSRWIAPRSVQPDGSSCLPCGNAFRREEGALRLVEERPGRGKSEIELKWAGIPGDYVGKQLKVAGEAPVQGGTIDLCGTRADRREDRRPAPLSSGDK